LYPKKTDKDLYLKLLRQCSNYSITLTSNDVIDNFNKYDLIIDCMFGFSFKGDVRPPFDEIIKVNIILIEKKLNETKVKIVSVDIPSGWDVEKGNTMSTFNPQMLISLTLPKLGMINYNGIHYVAGRFVPSSLINKYNLKMPKYEGSEMFKLINN
jgi:NAD(P)H-hydrate epimerase